ncbi:MAG: hypothetical protein P1V51_04090 [Deltaproteobacteria bacterium]|nr:hypothetical protein [Deltaproteobacteria bacterium]
MVVAISSTWARTLNIPSTPRRTASCPWSETSSELGGGAGDLLDRRDRLGDRGGLLLQGAGLRRDALAHLGDGAPQRGGGLVDLDGDVPEGAGHLVEGGGEVGQLVGGVHLHRPGEISLLHAPRAFDQLVHGAQQDRREAPGDDDREADEEGEGDRHPDLDALSERDLGGLDLLDLRAGALPHDDDRLLGGLQAPGEPLQVLQPPLPVLGRALEGASIAGRLRLGLIGARPQPVPDHGVLHLVDGGLQRRHRPGEGLQALHDPLAERPAPRVTRGVGVEEGPGVARDLD